MCEVGEACKLINNKYVSKTFKRQCPFNNGVGSMNKVKIFFDDIELTVNVPVGSRVIDISEQVGASLIYGCRKGDCGKCKMKVLDGWENLSEPSEIEAGVLKKISAGEDIRLACQAQVLGDIKITAG